MHWHQHFKEIFFIVSKLSSRFLLKSQPYNRFSYTMLTKTTTTTAIVVVRIFTPEILTKLVIKCCREKRNRPSFVADESLFVVVWFRRHKSRLKENIYTISDCTFPITFSRLCAITFHCRLFLFKQPIKRATNIIMKKACQLIIAGHQTDRLMQTFKARQTNKIWWYFSSSALLLLLFLLSKVYTIKKQFSLTKIY